MAALHSLAIGDTLISVAHRFGVHQNTLLGWKRRWGAEGTVSPRKRKGRPRKLSADQEQLLLNTLDEAPSATNTELLAFSGLEHISIQSVSKYLLRNGVSRKRVSDEPVNWPDDRVKAEIKQFQTDIAAVPPEKRVYMDESYAYTNEAPGFGRAKKGKRVRRHREKWGKKFTFSLAVRLDGVVHAPHISTQSMNDVNFLAYVRDVLAPSLRPGETVIWDRLGRAGRAKNPTKQHYNPEVRRMIEENGCSLLFLPPKGKWWNPIELAFGKAKNHIRQSYVGSQAAKERRHRTDNETIAAIQAGCARLTAQDMAGYWRERGTNRAFLKLYPELANL